MSDKNEATKKEPFHIDNVEALFTRKRAEDGIKIPVLTPTGEETDGWLRICSAEARSYKKAQIAIMRKYGDLSDDKIPDVEAKRDARDLDLACAFVMGWNLPLEFNPDNVRNVLDNIPKLRDSVVNHGVMSELFFGAAQIDS